MRSLSRIAACSVAGLLAACGGEKSGDADGTTAAAPAVDRGVNVYNWPDYIAPGPLEQFEAETGIKVNYSTFESNEMLETQLLTGKAGHDVVVVVTSNFLQRQVEAGAKNATSVRYATFNRAALPLIDEAMTSDPSIYPAPEVRARLRATQPRSLEDRRVENRIWTRFRTGQ